MNTRRGRPDAVVVGGGVVGAACALALADLGLEVALAEAQAPPPWRADRPDLRVYAFAPDNVALLQRLGVWPQIVAARTQPYRRMRVWDAAGGGELAFDADAFGRSELGWIVEHGLLVDKLWAALPGAGVRVSCPAKVEALEQLDDGVRLRLDDGTRIEAGLAIAADGAESSVRTLAGLDVDTHSYAQRGVVAYVSTERPHENTAWQRFLPPGPLAFLPCADGSSSIVWTLPEAEAARIAALDDDAFGAELTAAFDARLGKAAPLSKRVAFPLRRPLVRDYAIGRVVAIGDAAHVVHPLAGQGVTLGLRDVSALCEAIGRAKLRRADFASPQRLARWARERKSENALAAYAFDGINRAFSNDDMAATLLRGHALRIADRVPMIAHGLWRRAAGLSA